MDLWTFRLFIFNCIQYLLFMYNAPFHEYIFVTFISFISALIFMISFLLLSLGFLCSSFSSYFRCKVRLFIWDFSSFFRWAWFAMNFPLRTAFAASHRFWIIVFSLSFVSRYFLISSLISSVISWLFNSALFSLHVFRDF